MLIVGIWRAGLQRFFARFETGYYSSSLPNILFYLLFLFPCICWLYPFICWLYPQYAFSLYPPVRNSWLGEGKVSEAVSDILFVFPDVYCILLYLLTVSPVWMLTVSPCTVHNSWLGERRYPRQYQPYCLYSLFPCICWLYPLYAHCIPLYVTVDWVRERYLRQYQPYCLYSLFPCIWLYPRIGSLYPPVRNSWLREGKVSEAISAILFVFLISLYLTVSPYRLTVSPCT